MSYQKLRVYQAAVELRAEVDKLRKVLIRKPEFLSLFAHVDDAVDSIQNNIAEGSSSVYPGKQAKFFDIALGSADEVRSGLRSLSERGAFGSTKTYRATALAFTIAKMLWRMINHARSLQSK